MTRDDEAKAESDLFEAAREKFEEMLAHMLKPEPGGLGKIEEYLRVEGLELQRRLLRAVEAKREQTKGAKDGRRSKGGP